MTLITLTIATMISTSAMAAATHSCEGLDIIGALVGQTQSFNQVKVAYVSTEEPEVAPDHLLVFVYDNEMGVKCTAISHDAGGTGFGYVDMETLKLRGQDTHGGVLLQIDIHEPNDATSPAPQTVRFRVDVTTGKVTVEKA